MFISPAIISSFSKTINPTWLTGPIFDKELRVSSRRRRNYVLRFIYLAVLTIFVVLVWSSTVRFQGTGAYQISQMSEAGLAIITTILMFQFVSTQLIAVAMMSTSISDEIYNRTLGVLMTTPINSFQIVMGKLFSKLLQLLLLLAISLPLLAIVRVFGGVPWGYVLSSLCITLTAIIFAGSLSLYFSISSRRAYAVIIKTIFALGAFYIFIPVLVTLSLDNLGMKQQGILFSVLTLPNPFIAMQLNTMTMMSPGALGGVSFLSWPFHCISMLVISALLLAWCVKIVRKVALRQVAGQPDPTVKRSRKQKKGLAKKTKSQARPGIIRPITGSPVIWRELRAPMIQGGRTNGIIGFAIAVTFLLITYLLNIKDDIIFESFAHVAYVLVFVIIGLISNIVLSATTITSEKETRSWPILLATSMSDWQILIGKAVGVFRRCLPVWLLLAGHLVVFIILRCIHPIALIHLAMLVTWIVVFLSGTGLYFSACFKRTASAVVANFALAVTLWAIIPLLLGLISTISRNLNILNAYISTNPVTQAVVLMEGAGGRQNAASSLARLNYSWPIDNNNYNPWPRCDDAGETTAFMMVSMLIYMGLGAFFAWRAKCRFRRNIF